MSACFLTVCSSTCFGEAKTNEKQEQVAEVLSEKYQESVNELLPLTPEQINAFEGKMDKTEKAIRNLPAPKVTSRTLRVSLSPGSEIPTIEIVPGYVASVVLYDVTGAPWPGTSQTNGNQNFFQVDRPDVQPGNFLTVSAKANHASTNVIVTLLGHDIPLTVHLKTVDSQKDNRTTDGIVALQIDQRGPNAALPSIGETRSSALSDDMLSFIDGNPQNAERLKIEPEVAGLDAWLLNNYIYVRSEYALFWPSWDETASGAGGKHKVYRMPNVPSIIVSVNGKTQTFNIKKM